MAARSFDSYVAVDWSARATRATGADSIWIAVLDRGSAVRLSNPATRHDAARELGDILGERSSGRVLVGIDVALGYPSGTAAAIGLDGEPPWWAMWCRITESIVDDARNRNNRFEVAGELNLAMGASAGPFWGCPQGRSVDGLAPTKPPVFNPAEFRTTERVLRSDGRRPMSVWQLTGSGSVGSQTLTADPVVQRLIADLGRPVHVWPFTTGLALPPLDGGGVVVAEMWPTAFDPPLHTLVDGAVVRDAAQVRHVVERCAAADADGALASWFSPVGAVGADTAAVVAEEGWVLAPPRPPLLR